MGTKVILRKAEIEHKEKATLQTPHVFPRKKFRIIRRKKGKTRREREKQEKGDRNEAGFFKLVVDWINKIEFWLKNNGIEIEAEKTAKHHPKKIDLRDKNREDVLISFAREKKNFLLIYDVKSSFRAAYKQNRCYKVRIQKGICRIEAGMEVSIEGFLKKAIVFNPKLRMEQEALAEVLHDAFRISGISFPLSL